VEAGESIDLAAADAILEAHGLDSPRRLARHSRAKELLIPLLQEIQETYGYLPKPVLEHVSRATGITLSSMYGVITFYTQFYLAPRGRHIVRCCQGTACHVKGAMRVSDAVEEHLGIGEGETTEDGRYTFEIVQCLGTCFLAPVVMIDDDYHGELTAESIRKVLDRYE
jgi:NADH-quinone oxidoreductase subunit E